MVAPTMRINRSRRLLSGPTLADNGQTFLGSRQGSKPGQGQPPAQGGGFGQQASPSAQPQPKMPTAGSTPGGFGPTPSARAPTFNPMGRPGMGNPRSGTPPGLNPMRPFAGAPRSNPNGLGNAPLTPRAPGQLMNTMEAPSGVQRQAGQVSSIYDAPEGMSGHSMLGNQYGAGVGFFGRPGGPEVSWAPTTHSLQTQPSGQFADLMNVDMTNINDMIAGLPNRLPFEDGSAGGGGFSDGSAAQHYGEPSPVAAPMEDESSAPVGQQRQEINSAENGGMATGTSASGLGVNESAGQDAGDDDYASAGEETLGATPGGVGDSGPSNPYETDYSGDSAWDDVARGAAIGSFLPGVGTGLGALGGGIYGLLSGEDGGSYSSVDAGGYGGDQQAWLEFLRANGYDVTSGPNGETQIRGQGGRGDSGTFHGEFSNPDDWTPAARALWEKFQEQTQGTREAKRKAARQAELDSLLGGIPDAPQISGEQTEAAIRANNQLGTYNSRQGTQAALAMAGRGRLGAGALAGLQAQSSNELALNQQAQGAMLRRQDQMQNFESLRQNFAAQIGVYQQFIAKETDAAVRQDAQNKLKEIIRMKAEIDQRMQDEALAAQREAQMWGMAGTAFGSLLGAGVSLGTSGLGGGGGNPSVASTVSRTGGGATGGTQGFINNGNQVIAARRASAEGGYYG